MGVRQVFKDEVKAVEAEMKKAKTYFKRTGDKTVAITQDAYLELLDFKRKVLKDVLKRSKKGDTK